MKKIILLLIVVVVAVMLAFMSLPDDPGHQQTSATVKQPSGDGSDSEVDAEQLALEAARDERLAAMKREYKELERERRDLRLRLHDIAYYAGQADLPDEQHSEMHDEIAGYNRILINPPLLGAFRGVDDIKQELRRFANINDQLDEYERIIREHGGYDETD